MLNPKLKETSLPAQGNVEEVKLPGFKGKKVEGNFQGGEVSSDGGLMLLKEMDERLGLSKKINGTLKDPQNPDMMKHRQIDMLRQGIYGLACGYEDLNDHNTLCKDLVWQTAVEQTQALASSPTLCRLEGRVEKETAWAIHEIMVDQFISSFQKAPEELILDFDATDDRVHGKQEGRAFHGYYREWCFLPLYVFCGE